MKLYDHQQKLVDKAPEKWLCAHGTGSGKTITSIFLAKQSPEIETLVIVPKSLVEQWQEECKKHTHFFEVISKETFRRDHKDLRSYNSVIVDEADFFAGLKSGLYKSLKWYFKKHDVKYRWLLTATPYRSTILNLLALGILLGKDWNWRKWNNLFFSQIKMGSRYIPVQKTIIEGEPITWWITKIVNLLGNSVSMEQCFDVPEQTFIVERFKLTPEQKKAIKELDDVVAIARRTRRHEIENGILLSDGYTEDRTFKCEKNNRILELCDRHKKIAICCRYLLQIKVYEELLKGKKIFIINGATKNKLAVTKEIEKTEECVVLIQTATCVGYQLPNVNVIIMASYEGSIWSLIQIRGRFLRADKLSKNVYISLVQEKGTIDYDVYDSLINKKEDYHLAVYK